MFGRGLLQAKEKSWHIQRIARSQSGWSEWERKGSGEGEEGVGKALTGGTWAFTLMENS